MPPGLTQASPPEGGWGLSRGVGFSVQGLGLPSSTGSAAILMAVLGEHAASNRLITVLGASRPIIAWSF